MSKTDGRTHVPPANGTSQMSTLIPPVEGNAPLWLWSWYCQRSPGVGCHMPEPEGEIGDDAGGFGSRPAPVHADGKSKMGTVRTAISFTCSRLLGYHLLRRATEPKETILSTKFVRASSAALIGLALVAAACSKGSDPGPSSTSSTSSTSSAEPGELTQRVELRERLGYDLHRKRRLVRLSLRLAEVHALRNDGAERQQPVDRDGRNGHRSTS